MRTLLFPSGRGGSALWVGTGCHRRRAAPPWRPAQPAGPTPMNLSPDKQREMLRQMLTIRRFEERASADYLAGRIYGVVHCYIGEEAVAVGVCSTLKRGD